jgi:hypothetical protein
MESLRMSFKDKQDIYAFNNKRRERLLSEAMNYDRAEDRLKFVVDYFLNKLDPAAVAQIDDCAEGKIVPFKYDYSFLEDYGSDDIRVQDTRRWGGFRHGVSLPQADNDIRPNEQIKIYPAVYALKMGTCVMFASEIQRFARDFGLESEIVKSMDDCYDKFDGMSTENKPIHTDRIIKMEHFYNVVVIDGTLF